MPFFVQYNTTAGEIEGTVSGLSAPENLPEERGQLEFPEWQDTSGKMVDVVNKTLIDIPPADPQVE